MINQCHDNKNVENQKIDINKNINKDECNENNKKKNSEIKLLNNIEEIKNLVEENLNHHKSQIIFNDFNIKEFEKENYNEPRSRVMLWIQKSFPINQFESYNNNSKNKDNNKIAIINNEGINNKINNKQNNKTEKIPHYQLPIRHSVNEQNNNINKKKLDKIKITNRNKKEGKHRAISQSKNPLNYKNYYKTAKANTKEKYNIKKIMTKKHYKSSEHSNKNLNIKSKRQKENIHIEKSKSTMKSKSPKNTFLVFNTININLGDNQKDQKQVQTPNRHEIKDINSSLNEDYLRNNFFFDSIPSFLKNKK